MLKRKLKSGSGKICLLLGMVITIAACAGMNGSGLDQPSTSLATIISVKAETGPDTDKVIIIMEPTDSPTPYSVYQWNDPTRVVVDIPGSLNGKVPSVIPVSDDLVRDIEIEQIEAGEESSEPKVRVVISVNGPVSYDPVKEEGQLVLSLRPELAAAPAEDLFPMSPTTVLVENGNSLEVAPAESDNWVWIGPESGDATSEAPKVSSSSEKPAKNLQEIQVENDGDLTRVSLGIDGNLGDYSAFTLDDPDRLVVDLWGLNNSSSVLNKDINQQGILRVRIGQHPDKVRLVFDATGQMPHFRFDKDSSRLVVTFSKTMDVAASPDFAVAMTSETAGSSPAIDDTPELSADQDWPVMESAQSPWPGIETEPTPSTTPTPVTPSTPAADSPPSRSSDVGAWPDTIAPMVVGGQKPGVAYVDSVKFDYTPEASTIVIHADRPVRRDQWEIQNNVDKNVSEKVVTVFIYNAQLAADQQKSFDTSEFYSPIDLFSVFQSPGREDQIGLVIVLNSWAASKWDQVDNKLVIKFENTPGSLGIGGQPDSGFFGPQQDQSTGGAAGGYPSAPGPSLSGPMVSIDVKNMDIIDVLRMIAASSPGMNIVVSDKVKGRITISLDNVPWDQALDIILETQGLEKREIGNVIRIAPSQEFAQEQAEEFRRKQEVEKYEDLEIRIIPINYLDAQQLRQIIQPLLTQGRGRVNTDRRTNSLVIRDRPEVLDQIYALVKQLDRPTKQVLIEARIVEATEGVTQEIGVRWGTNVNIGPTTGTPTGMQFPNNIQVGGAVLGGAADASNSAPAASGGGGAVGISVGHLTNVVELDLLLRALETQEKVKIISSPRVLTLTDERAVIQQGVSIPYPPPAIIGGTAVGWTFVEASLRLEVTPHVAADNTITLEVTAANNEPVTIPGSDRPGVSRKEASTTILLNNGETAVIGGIFKITRDTPTTQVPYLGNLPYIGRLFSTKVKRTRNEELIIFLTPQIVENGAGMDSVPVVK